MLNSKDLQDVKSQQRTLKQASGPEPALGPLEHLPGTWKSDGMGWNMIALPFAAGPLGYRLLLNQYNETLEFTLVDKGVPNRGVGANGQTDQLIATLDYTQQIVQVAAVDSPLSGEAGGANLAIHHEPGLWLHMLNETQPHVDIARLSSIPHGDSVLALGSSEVQQGGVDIPEVNGLPVGVSHDLASPYLAPYKQFNDAPFKGNVTAAGFPGFNPLQPNALLSLANQGVDIVETTTLSVDSTVATAGVTNIPFIVKQANADSMKSTFWIQRLADGSRRLQYSQIVMLDFFSRGDGLPGRIRWPHVSINTLTKE
ncbi:MAG: hypothetical protein GYB33_14330 [Gammaproteobacteria bacterium]|nr:hypothetical protein [Gammaproteobacteria bacterium]